MSFKARERASSPDRPPIAPVLTAAPCMASWPLSGRNGSCHRLLYIVIWLRVFLLMCCLLTPFIRILVDIKLRMIRPLSMVSLFFSLTPGGDCSPGGGGKPPNVVHVFVCAWVWSWRSDFRRSTDTALGTNTLKLPDSTDKTKIGKTPPVQSLRWNWVDGCSSSGVWTSDYYKKDYFQKPSLLRDGMTRVY